MEEICKEIEKDIKKSKALAKGTQGITYDLGEVVIKATKSQINDVILQRMSDAGVSPKVLNIYKCNGITYILMEKLTEPFKDSKHGNQVRNLMFKMIRAGVFHNDIHAENMMAKNGRLYFLDFDNASLIDNMTQKEFDEAFKYHTSYTDETYSKRIPIQFTEAQLKELRSRFQK